MLLSAEAQQPPDATCRDGRATSAAGRERHRGTPRALASVGARRQKYQQEQGNAPTRAVYRRCRRVIIDFRANFTRPFPFSFLRLLFRKVFLYLPAGRVSQPSSRPM